MEHGPFEDVFPSDNGDIPILCKFIVSLLEGTSFLLGWPILTASC